MIANIKNYLPENVEFVISDKARELFPEILFDGEESIQKIEELVNEKFVAIFPEHENAYRKLDDHEVYEIREEYCELQENVIPTKLQELADAIEESKRIKREAEESLASIQSTIRDLAGQVKEGIKEMPLSPTHTIRIALCGHYLYYTWLNGKFVLAKSEIIPEWDKGYLWSQEIKNRESMQELFGISFPEIQDVKNEDESEEF